MNEQFAYSLLFSSSLFSFCCCLFLFFSFFLLSIQHAAVSSFVLFFLFFSRQSVPFPSFCCWFVLAFSLFVAWTSRSEIDSSLFLVCFSDRLRGTCGNPIRNHIMNDICPSSGTKSILCCIIVICYNSTCRIQRHNMKTQWIKTSEEFFKKIYLSLYLKGLCVCERGSWRLNKDCNILTSPATPDIAVCRSRSPGLLNRGLGGPASLGHILIPAFSHQLVSKLTDLQLTDFLSSPSYIIIQSPTQSLEWYVWSSSSGNNCHAVHRSLSSGAPVYECTMGFYLVPFFQPSPSTRFLLITAIGIRGITLEWHVCPGQRSIYNI